MLKWSISVKGAANTLTHVHTVPNYMLRNGAMMCGKKKKLKRGKNYAEQ